MDLDVVRMAVAPVGVVDREHVRTLLAQHVSQGGGASDGVLVGEGGRVVRVGVQARVGVAQTHDARTSQDPCGGDELGHPDVGETVAVAIPVAGEATLARGRRDEHDAVSFGGRSAKQAARQQRLVVGVGMERDQRETCARGDHGSSTASSRTPRVRE